jgi:hypothetical protein
MANVERVKLPRLIRIDQPEPSYLPEYVKNLSDAITRPLQGGISFQDSPS